MLQKVKIMNLKNKIIINKQKSIWRCCMKKSDLFYERMCNTNYKLVISN